MAWVLFNEQRDSYWHPDLPRGVTLLHPERAYRWDTRAEAAEVCDRLNRTVVHGGECVRDDGWTVVER